MMNRLGRVLKKYWVPVLAFLAGILFTQLAETAFQAWEARRSAPAIRAAYSVTMEEISSSGSDGGQVSVRRELRDPLNEDCSLGIWTETGDTLFLAEPPSSRKAFFTVIIQNSGRGPETGIEIGFRGTGLGRSPGVISTPNVEAVLREDLSDGPARYRVVEVGPIPAGEVVLIQIQSVLDSVAPGVWSLSGYPTRTLPTLTGKLAGEIDPPREISSIDAEMSLAVITGGDLTRFDRTDHQHARAGTLITVLDPGDPPTPPRNRTPSESYQFPGVERGGCPVSSPDSIWMRRIGAWPRG